MERKNHEKTKAVVISEYDRLVAEERELDPIRFSFLQRGYYVRKLALSPSIPTNSESYIYKILKTRFAE